jgi:hypothetical protein
MMVDINASSTDAFCEGARARGYLRQEIPELSTVFDLNAALLQSTAARTPIPRRSRALTCGWHDKPLGTPDTRRVILVRAELGIGDRDRSWR